MSLSLIQIVAQYAALKKEDGADARELIRSLVAHVTLHPEDKGQRVEVRGELAAILALAGGTKANGAKVFKADDAVTLS